VPGIGSGILIRGEMLVTIGVLLLACLVAALAIFAWVGVRNAGWVGVLLGLAGAVYSFVSYPDRLLLIVSPLSVILILFGFGALVAGFLRRKTPPKQATG
jgi:hypothetical protein